jgi:hypothetical protein
MWAGHDPAAGSLDFAPGWFNIAAFWVSAAGCLVVSAAVLAPDRTSAIFARHTGLLQQLPSGHGGTGGPGAADAGWYQPGRAAAVLAKLAFDVRTLFLGVTWSLACGSVAGGLLHSAGARAIAGPPPLPPPGAPGGPCEQADFICGSVGHSSNLSSSSSTGRNQYGGRPCCDYGGGADDSESEPSAQAVLLALAIGLAAAWSATFCARSSQWARPAVGAISGHGLGFLGLKIVQCAELFNMHPDFRDVFRLYDPTGCTCSGHCPPGSVGNSSASLGGNSTHLVTPWVDILWLDPAQPRAALREHGGIVTAAVLADANCTVGGTAAFGRSPDPSDPDPLESVGEEISLVDV